MRSTYSILVHALSPGTLGKLIRTFDRVTLLINTLCWTTTLAVMALALVTVNLSIKAQKEALAAEAAEPILPKINRAPVNARELQSMIERLQRRYPDVTVAFQNGTLSVSAGSGEKYHQWLAALGQIDTIYPQFHWNIKSFCVGTSCTGNLMSVELGGEKISFEMPQLDEKK